MLRQVTAPAAEPIDLTYLHTRARIIDTTEDTFLTMLITAARAYAESYCNRSFITQQWQLVLDSFPGGCNLAPWGEPYSIPDSAILLDRGTVQSIDSIKYLDMGGVLQTLAPSTYVADLSGCPARVTPVFGQVWPPNTMPQIGSVQIAYTAGYGSLATDVPAGIRDWIAMRVGTVYENREEAALLNKGKLEPLPWVDTLLDPYRVVQA